MLIWSWEIKHLGCGCAHPLQTLARQIQFLHCCKVCTTYTVASIYTLPHQGPKGLVEPAWLWNSFPEAQNWKETESGLRRAHRQKLCKFWPDRSSTVASTYTVASIYTVPSSKPKEPTDKGYCPVSTLFKCWPGRFNNPFLLLFLKKITLFLTTFLSKFTFLSKYTFLSTFCTWQLIVTLDSKYKYKWTMNVCPIISDLVGSGSDRLWTLCERNVSSLIWIFKIKCYNFPWIIVLMTKNREN